MIKKSATFPSSWYWIIFLLFTAVYIKGLFNIVYGVDAKIYASISREMLETGNWLQVYLKGNDYLDKPPLLFWLSALSYKFFGVGAFGYKLPSFLFTLLGVFSTYKLGELLYNKQVGKLASLLYYTCFVIVIINQDVRTDTILTGILVFSIWQLIAYIKTNKSIYFVLGFIGIGLAMLAKGPMGLMIPILCIGTEILVKRDWKSLFKWQWLLGLFLSFVVISPMLYGLYTQFDAQPNKVFTLASGMEMQNYSGLKFYFWDQSFGRIFGGNAEGWKNDTTPFFFTHTFLWSYLPWTFIGIVALVVKIIHSVKNPMQSEWYTIGAIIIPFVAFSMSSYKLPHYIIPIFPYLFILTGSYLIKNTNATLDKLNEVTQLFLSVILLIASLLILVYLFPNPELYIWGVYLFVGLILLYVWIKFESVKRYLIIGCLSMGLAVFVFNFHFVPSMLQYEATYQAAKKAKELNINTIYLNTILGFSLDLYTTNPVQEIDYNKIKSLSNKNNAFFVEDKYLKDIKANVDVKKIFFYKHKELTRLTPQFLNPQTREEELSTYCLVLF